VPDEWTTGHEVVEPHVEDEDGRGHDELSVVLARRAVFNLDGESLAHRRARPAVGASRGHRRPRANLGEPDLARRDGTRP
jgi:hypothetical protein